MIPSAPRRSRIIGYLATLLGAFFAALLGVTIAAAFTGPTQAPPSGSGVISVSGNNASVAGGVSVGTGGSINGSLELFPNNAGSWFWIDNNGGTLRFSSGSAPGGSPMTYSSAGNLAVPGTISGTYTGTIASGNVSAGTFGANTGGGNYAFPASVGIGTSAPNAPLQVVGAAKVYNSTNNEYDANMEVQGTYSSRTVGTGAALGFVVPANTDGSNPWEQGRILVTPDNSSNGDAHGRMYLQTRGQSGSTWVWENNLVLTSNGNVGIDTTSPGYALDVNGTVRVGGGNGVAIVGSATPIQDAAFMLGSDSGSYDWIQSYNGTPLSINPLGNNVGIDTTSPAQTLTVNGSLSATSYCISGSNCITAWPSGAGATTTAANVSAGTFGANTGGGNYAFPAGVTATGVTISGTNPAYILQNSGTAEGEVALATANGAYSTDAATNDMVIRTTGSNGRILFNTNGGAGASTLAVNGGEVGIGTASPSDILTVSGSFGGGNLVKLTNTASGGESSIIYSSSGQSDWVAGSGAWGNIGKFIIGSGGALVAVETNGNVGIGTTSPGQKLDVAGKILAAEGSGTSGGYSFENDGAYDTGMFSPSDGITNFYNNGVQNLQFTPSGGTFYTGVTMNAGLGVTGNITASGEIIGTLGSGSAQFRAVSGNYGFMIRNDGATTYFLLTASGSPDGGWNSLRPMAINDSSGDVTFGQNVIINGKLTVPTIDPVYTINGTNYATYGLSMTGVNEETDGVATLTRGANGIYSATIDFAAEPTGSNLWLFAQATNLKANLAQLVALLTPTFEGKVWYTENTSTESVTINAAPSATAGQAPATVQVSYRFTAPRFDAAHWSNYASSTAKGLVVTP